MKNRYFTMSLMLCLFLSVFTVYALPFTFVYAEEEEIIIASWNLLTFGKTSLQTDEKFRVMAAILNGSNYPDEVGKQYDLIFVQELLSDGEAFDKLCQDYLGLMDYQCKKTFQCLVMVQEANLMG
ncbi:MAG: hypothetical protein HRO68_02630 [Nitrosopumilus sp.]|nr:hypothetical protein [Nitrosopumilus sp.]